MFSRTQWRVVRGSHLKGGFSDTAESREAADPDDLQVDSAFRDRAVLA